MEARWLGVLPYADALGLQEQLVSRRRAGEIPDQLLMLEHPHVITMGSSSTPEHILADANERARLGIELHETRRGGDVTYHGPGQLVGYPILDLKPDRKDLHRYLRDLEDVIIRVLARWDIEGWRSDGFTGVWTEAGKVAAIGVRVSSGWITSHGFALNVATDLDYFSTIVPCGLQDRNVASMKGILGEAVSMVEVREAMVEELGVVFGASVEQIAGLPSN